MSMPSFTASKAGYTKLWKTIVIRPERLISVHAIAMRRFALKATYQEVQRLTGVPWFVIALIDQMESGGNANRHLHNGDPLSARTVQVPSGRPPLPQEPPFTFSQSAVDALEFDGLDKVLVWTVERIAYELERYNGSGYYAVGICSPYLWSFSNHYTSGKYIADGKYDANAVSTQCGAMPILAEMAEIDQTLLGVPPVPEPAPAPTPVPTTAPTLVGLTLSQWAAVEHASPGIMTEVEHLSPEVLSILTRINAALQGGRA